MLRITTPKIHILQPYLEEQATENMFFTLQMDSIQGEIS